MTYSLLQDTPSPGWYSVIKVDGDIKTIIWSGKHPMLSDSEIWMTTHFFNSITITIKQAVSICHELLGRTTEVGDA